MAITKLDMTNNDCGRVFGLLAGKSGIGKTTQITTFPKEEVLAVSVEDGFLSIQGSGVDAIRVENFDDVIAVLEGLYSSPYKYIVIDSLSEIYNFITVEAKDKFTASQNFQKHDYIKERLMYAIRKARVISGKDIFFTCHTKEEKSGMVLEQELGFDGKLPSEIKSQFDLVIHMDERTDEKGIRVRTFITDPTVSKVSKTRVSPFLGITVLPNEEPNLYELTKKLKGMK